MRASIVCGAVLACLVIAGLSAFWVVRRSTQAHGATCAYAWRSRTVPARPIVAFGDSITWGYGASRNCVPKANQSILPLARHVASRADTSYPGELSLRTGQPILNLGVSGETADAGARRLASLLQRISPSWVVLLECVNDLRRGTAPHVVFASLQSMVRTVERGRARPVLILVTPVRGSGESAVAHLEDRIMALNRELAHFAARRHVPLVDATMALGRPGMISDDDLHPTDAGYRALAGAVARAVWPR